MNDALRSPYDALPIPAFLDYLRAGRIPEEFLPAYRSEAERFRDAFPDVALGSLSAAHVAAHVASTKRAGGNDRALRNARIVGDAVLAFLARPIPRPSQPPPPAPRAPAPGDHRRFLRVPFVAEVEIHGVGRRRCSDLSLGGLYLDSVDAFQLGERLALRFKLRPADARAIDAEANVAYQHPGLGAGLNFVRISHDDLAAIEAFVTACAKSR